jgi:hypothetical protein
MTVGQLRREIEEFDADAPIVIIVDDDVADCDLTTDTLVIDQCSRTGCDEPEGCAIVLRAATKDEIAATNTKTTGVELAVIDGGETE